MDAYPTDRAVSYLDQSPLLVAGTSDAAISRALRTIEARGGRIASNDGRVAWLHPRNPLSLSVELFDPSWFNLEQ